MKDREKESADAYLNFLQSKGASSGTLYLRSRFLDKLKIELKGKEQNRLAYAQALKETRNKLEHEDQQHALSTAREFFPFWMQDIKSIAKFQKEYGFNVHASHWKPKQKALKDLVNAAETDIFTHAETITLDTYTEKVLKTTPDASSVNERIKLAKIILTRLRDAPEKNLEFYRTAIELTTPLFKDKNKRSLYLTVVREFYDFWKSTPDVYS